MIALHELWTLCKYCVSASHMNGFKTCIYSMYKYYVPHNIAEEHEHILMN